MRRMSNRKMVSLCLPIDLSEEIRKEAELREADRTAIVEERLRRVSPLHRKIDEILKLLRKGK